MRAGSALVPTMVIAFAACARDAGDAGSGQTAAGGDTGMPRAPESTVSQPSSSQPSGSDRASPPPSGGRASKPPTQRPAEGAPPPAAGRPPPAADEDTARGIIAVVGAVPITEVILRPASGRPITLTGPLAREVGIASGADVWVRGRRVGARAIEVVSYEVRSADGVPAITGTLTADGDRLVLVTDDGRRHPIARPPAPLREHVGARVWITGDPATTINAYGVLRPRR